jgi:hypothetical protein
VTALLETFRNRQTSIEKRISIFEDKFKNDDRLQSLWTSFLKKRLLNNDNSFSEIVSQIENFIEPVFVEVNTSKTWNCIGGNGNNYCK